jgi:hypothetical protein
MKAKRDRYNVAGFAIVAGLVVSGTGRWWGIALLAVGLVLLPLRDGLRGYFVVRHRPQAQRVRALPESWLQLAQDLIDQPGRTRSELEASGWSAPTLQTALPALVAAGLVAEYHLGPESGRHVTYRPTPKAAVLLQAESRRRQGGLFRPRSRNSTLAERLA